MEGYFGGNEDSQNEFQDAGDSGGNEPVPGKPPAACFDNQGYNIVYNKSCSGEEQERLTEKFDLLRQENKVHLCFELYFKWIEHQCPMVMIRECYRKQYGLLTWGYPIMLYRIRNQKLQLRYMGFTEEIIKLLREKDGRIFRGMEGAYGTGRAGGP